jgi:hypothetical protein
MTTAYTPSAARDPIVLWVCDRAANDAPAGERTSAMPLGAVACSVDEALVWAHEGLPPELVARWVDGVIVQTPPDPSDLVRRAARALRERLELRERGRALDVARAWGHPAIVAAVGRLTSRRAPTLADLARALARIDHPEADRLARMCWALEQL